MYQGEPSPYRGGKGRGTPSTDLPPTAFVLFLQNHDQVGNRAFGERLTSLTKPAALKAAIALQLLCPQIPLMFMGEENASEAPFLFFTDHNEALARAVRDGRRREFASFKQFSDPELLQKIPDPNARETFDQSKPVAGAGDAESRQDLYRRLLTLRRENIVPRLNGTRALDAQAVGPAAVSARWRMGDGVILILACNLGSQAATIEPIRQDLLFATSETALRSARDGRLQAIFDARPHGAAMNDAAVYDLAERAGIAIEWRDYTERSHRVSLDTIRHILTAIGLPCQTADDLAESRHRLDARAPPPDDNRHDRSADTRAMARRRAFATEHQVRRWNRCRPRTQASRARLHTPADREGRLPSDRHRTKAVDARCCTGAMRNDCRYHRRRTRLGIGGSNIWPAFAR